MSLESMDLDSIDAEHFGASLTGIGVNLLVKDMARALAFHRDILGAKVFQPTADFAILTLAGSIYQLHADHTYHSHPLLGLVPESGPRGGGLEIRIYGDVDPDEVVRRAEKNGYSVLAPALDKPHGTREAFILCPDGYCWVPSGPKSA